MREFALQVSLLELGADSSRAGGAHHGWNEEVESNGMDFLIHGAQKVSNIIKIVRGAGWMVEKPR